MVSLEEGLLQVRTREAAVGILREAAAHRKCEGGRVGSSSTRNSITQPHEESGQMGGAKIHSILPGLLPPPIQARYLLAPSALHSFSQTVQPRAPPITPHLDTHRKER